MRAEAETTILRRDVRALGPNPGLAFDVVFLDPPYGKSMGGTVKLFQKGKARGRSSSVDGQVVVSVNQHPDLHVNVCGAFSGQPHPSHQVNSLESAIPATLRRR